jgi:nitrous oxide reductase accessory protein NosL
MTKRRNAMRKLLMAAAAVPLLLFALSPASVAGDCDGAAKIDEAGRKFAVFLPKVSEMAAQSFDDIGCAVLARNEECAMRQSLFDSNAMVHDYLSGEQLPAEKAYFVLRTGVRTPRAFGIAAFKDRAEAEKFSAAHGRGTVVKWFELVDEKLK